MADCYFDIETTGLNPFENRILTIQLKREDEIILWKLWEEKDEKELIIRLLEYLRDTSKYDSIYGYNCLKFDVPFVASRAVFHGIMNSKNYQTFYDRNWTDLYQFLGGGYISMDARLQSFGIRRLCPVRGMHIPSLFEQKRFAEIEEHAKEDVILCEKLVDNLNRTRERNQELE